MFETFVIDRYRSRVPRNFTVTGVCVPRISRRDMGWIGPIRIQYYAPYALGCIDIWAESYLREGYYNVSWTLPEGCHLRALGCKMILIGAMEKDVPDCPYPLSDGSLWSLDGEEPTQGPSTTDDEGKGSSEEPSSSSH